LQRQNATKKNEKLCNVARNNMNILPYSRLL
jgi:hypothetical protein